MLQQLTLHPCRGLSAVNIKATLEKKKKNQTLPPQKKKKKMTDLCSQTELN